MKSLFFIFTWLITLNFAVADDGAYLDPYYGKPDLPNVTKPLGFDLESNILSVMPKVDHLETAKAQTEVKSQGRRGTCSIFSSTAILEYNLKRVGVTTEDLDLSEQWLEYITAGQRGSEGSWSNFNFNNTGFHGFVHEDTWGYNFNSWHPYEASYWEFQATEEEKAHFAQRCQPLEGSFYFDHCLIGQDDPKYLTMPLHLVDSEHPEMALRRREAQQNLLENGLTIGSTWVANTMEVQSRLDQGEVVALDLTFFYEAWNHRKGLEMGLTRDFALWGQGVVSYPSRDSLDFVESQKSDNRAGHSIVLVGYDPDVVIERMVKDRNGEDLLVKTTGVYYFKNSWGKDSFGVDFTFKGEALPGFGMISMDYAHEHGSFYRMVINQVAVNN